MRILITGICGFIGSHLAEAYSEFGNRVYGIDNLETGQERNWPGALIGDITQRSDFYQFANDVKPQLVVHCAASYKDPQKWHVDTDVNVAGAINVASVAKWHDCPIVYFQTVLPPISSYAISKIAGEQYLRLSGQPLTVYRLASVYGPRNLSGPIPTFYRRIKAGETCYAVKDTTRDFVFIDDLVEFVVGAESFLSATLDMRSGIETAIADLPQMIGEAMGEKPTVVLRDRAADDVAAYQMNGSPLSSAVDISRGIAHTVRWYEQHGVEQTYTHLNLEG
jgi:UDP-glucose 4-epimerase